jgi:CHAT domain/SIR2-like domain
MSDEQDLRERLRDGQVVVIVGAGVSMATVGDQLIRDHNVASWQGLLADGIEQARHGVDDDWRARRTAQLDSGQVAELVTAAQLITDGMGGRDHGDYAKWLADTIGELTPNKPELIQTLHGLGAPIATTNYDDLIEDVTRLGHLTWQDGLQWQSVLRGKRRGKSVLHLHGHYRAPRSVVLGMSSYEDVLRDASEQEMLKALALTSTFLLVGVGAGLDDPNFGALRKWLGQSVRGSMFPHYRLVYEGELTPEEAESDRDDRLVPIEYGKDHSALEPYLRGLTPQRRGIAGRDGGPRSLELSIDRDFVVAKATRRGVSAKEPLGLDKHRVSMVLMLEEWLRQRDDLDVDLQSGNELTEAQLLGRILYDSVIHGQIKRLYDEERAELQHGDRLTLVLKLARDGLPSLDADPGVELTALPWELLYGESEAWLARNGKVSLFRALPSVPEPRNSSREPLRILVVPAQPGDVLLAAQKRWPEQRTQAYDKSLKDIMDHFDRLRGHSAVEDVTILERPTLDEVGDALIGQNPPNIVHYIGYDSFSIASRRRCVAMVAEGSDTATWPNSQRFADEFSSAPPKLVFLHLCEGPREGYPDTAYDFGRASFTELARLLLDRGVQLVVAMQYPMSPDIGAKFTRQFYDSIGAGESVGQAVLTARLQAAKFYRLGAPVLYLHGADESLVNTEESADVPEPMRTATPVAKRDEDVRRPAATEPARREPARQAGGPPIQPRARTAAMLPAMSLGEIRLMGEVVATKAGYQGVAVEMFRQQAAELWMKMMPGEDLAGRVDTSKLADAARAQADENPAGDLAGLWEQLSDRIEPHRRASVGY